MIAKQLNRNLGEAKIRFISRSEIFIDEVNKEFAKQISWNLNEPQGEVKINIGKKIRKKYRKIIAFSAKTLYLSPF